MAQKFLRGLLPRLVESVASNTFTTVRQVADSAKSVEYVQRRIRIGAGNKRARDRDPGAVVPDRHPQGRRDPPRRPPAFRPPPRRPAASQSVIQPGGPRLGSLSGLRPADIGPCPDCGKRHVGQCPGGRRCYTCQQTGHFFRDCPLRAGQEQMDGVQGSTVQGARTVTRAPSGVMSSAGGAHTGKGTARAPTGLKTQNTAGPGQAKVFALTRQEAQASRAVTGIITIDTISAYVLFDSGATHSFISPKMVERLKAVPAALPRDYVVSTPLGGKVGVTLGVQCAGICIAGVIFSAELILLDTGDFDIIFGMDWLSTHHATIDCHERRICFNPPGKR